MNEINESLKDIKLKTEELQDNTLVAANWSNDVIDIRTLVFYIDLLYDMADDNIDIEDDIETEEIKEIIGNLTKILEFKETLGDSIEPGDGLDNLRVLYFY